ncbi:MAG: DNA polymerase III subunit delta [Pedosphaera sp.]|nr:DNA polymerase III subunit delta [Pedosphaera sp.]
MMAAAAESLKPLVLIWGEDDYAVKQRARQLFQEWSVEVGGFDHETIDATAANSGEAVTALGKLREALQTLPFFGGGKVILFQNCNFLGDERTASSQLVTEHLTDLAQELKAFSWKGVRLIISAGKVDKRKTFYKTLEKAGSVESFAGWSMEDKNWEAEAENSARHQVKALNKEISDAALAKLVQFVGPHPRTLAGEIEKLTLFVGEQREIVEEDISAVVCRNKQSQAFALADALGGRHLGRLLKTLDEELAAMKHGSQKSEIGLLYGLISKVRVMIFLKEMVRQGWIKADADYYRFKTQLERVPADQMPSDRRFNPLAMHPFMLHQGLGHTKNYTLLELIQAMELLLACNEKLISSSLDEALVLQQTLVKIVSRQAQPGVA